MSNGWIGVDLDGCLALYEGWLGPNVIGEPIAAMVERVKAWRREGLEVRIFTARISHDGTPERHFDACLAYMAISAWSRQHLGEVLPITNKKDYGMIELYDDRCVQVEANTGRLIGESTRGL